MSPNKKKKRKHVIKQENNDWYVHNYEEMLEDMNQRKSREQRLERYEIELKELYKKVDRKLDQIKRLRESRGIFTVQEREKR